MHNEPTTPRRETTRDLRKELIAAIANRFGSPRAEAMETEIAVAAETLARIAAVPLGPDAREPDYIGPISEAMP